jgi:hypothetical protein
LGWGGGVFVSRRGQGEGKLSRKCEAPTKGGGHVQGTRKKPHVHNGCSRHDNKKGMRLTYPLPLDVLRQGDHVQGVAGDKRQTLPLHAAGIQASGGVKSTGHHVQGASPALRLPHASHVATEHQKQGCYQRKRRSRSLCTWQPPAHEECQPSPGTICKYKPYKCT